MSYIEIPVSVDVDEVLCELSDKVLFKEVKRRGLTDEVITKEKIENSIIINPYDFRRQMCYILDCNYCVSDADLVKALLDKIH